MNNTLRFPALKRWGRTPHLACKCYSDELLQCDALLAERLQFFTSPHSSSWPFSSRALCTQHVIGLCKSSYARTYVRFKCRMVVLVTCDLARAALQHEICYKHNAKIHWNIFRRITARKWNRSWPLNTCYVALQKELLMRWHFSVNFSKT